MKKKFPLPLRNYTQPDKFGQWLGYKVTRFDGKKKEVEMALTLREDHLSPAGRVHGGVLSAFFDCLFGAAAFTTLEPEDFCSTVELKVNYLRPIELKDRLHALGVVKFRGKRLCVLSGEVRRGGKRGELVALASATFYVVTKK